jgi:hypothetical protein
VNAPEKAENRFGGKTNYTTKLSPNKKVFERPNSENLLLKIISY